MKITIRTRTLQTGSRSIYLDFYDKGKRWNEYLNLFLIPDDEPDAKRLNEAAMAKANAIKSKRMLGIEEETETNDKQSELPKRVFADWLTDHIEGIRRNPAYAASTYRNYRSTVNVIKAYLQHLHRPRLLMAKIDKGFVLGFIDFIEHTYRNTKSPDNPKEMSPHTLHLYQSTLVRMLNAAVKEGVLDRNPFYSLERKDRIGKRQTEKEYLTKEELKAFAEASTVNETTKRAFLFCCFTGLRYSDVSVLTWRDIRQGDNGWMVSVKAMRKNRQTGDNTSEPISGKPATEQERMQAEPKGF